MKILIAHNTYEYPGGEDVVAEQEAALLRSHGHTVVEYRRSNRELRADGLWNKFAAPQRVTWARDTVRELGVLMRQEKPQIAHFHNTFAMISPAAYGACKRAGIPVVQTLHNYRLLCPRSDFFRAGRACEACLHTRTPWPGIVHGCYRQSRAQTAVVALMLTAHRWLQTWQTQVDLYVTPTEFVRQKYIAGGFPAQKIVVKPHFVSSPSEPPQKHKKYALFVGRLSQEKNVLGLLSAWEAACAVPLKVIGSGPEESAVRELIHQRNLTNVELVGPRSHEQVLTLMQNAQFLVSPTHLYETFGLVAIEAFACGVPVIASRRGAIAEIVADGHIGVLFDPDVEGDLAAKVRWATTHPEAMADMGKNARSVYEEKYTPEVNYKLLLSIYERAIREIDLREIYNDVRISS